MCPSERPSARPRPRGGDTIFSSRAAPVVPSDRQLVKNGSAVQLVRIDFHVRDLLHGVVPDGKIEAVPASSMAGDTFLMDLQEEGVGIAIPAEIHQLLNLAGGFSLAPTYCRGLYHRFLFAEKSLLAVL